MKAEFKCRIDDIKNKDIQTFWTPLHQTIEAYEYYHLGEYPNYIVVSKETFYKCLYFQDQDQDLTQVRNFYTELDFTDHNYVYRPYFRGIPVAIDNSLDLGEFIVV